jgi:hypothetical protein
MKERFLNIMIFIISIGMIGLGVVMMFFNHLKYFDILHINLSKIFLSPGLTDFFIAFLGTVVFAWGIFFFLLMIFSVMDLRSPSVYGFIFWGFTFWCASVEAISYLKQYWFLMIIIGILYGVIFLPFFISLPMKSSGSR